MLPKTNLMQIFWHREGRFKCGKAKNCVHPPSTGLDFPKLTRTRPPAASGHQHNATWGQKIYASTKEIRFPLSHWQSGASSAARCPTFRRLGRSQSFAPLLILLITHVPCLELGNWVDMHNQYFCLALMRICRF